MDWPAGTLTAGLAAESLAGALPAPSGSASRNAPMERLRRQIDPDRVLLWENTRKEIRELLESGLLKAAILPAGSIEQHNEHIALVEDTAHATFYAKQIALELYRAGHCGSSQFLRLRALLDVTEG